jgi:hypothetical protein
MSSIHNFLHFRRHVQEMINSGQLIGRVETLIYAIKEREFRELRFRMPNILNAENRYQDPAYPIFSEDSLLTADDYTFLFESLDKDATRKMLEHLSIIKIEDEFYTEHSRYWVKAFLDNALRKEGDHNAIRADTLGNQNLIQLLLNCCVDVAEASAYYEGIVRAYAHKDSLNTIFYSNILSIVDKIKLLNSSRSTTVDEYQRHVDIESVLNSCREHFPANKVCIAETFKTYATAYWDIKSALHNEPDLTPETREALKSRMLHLHERVAHYATRMSTVLKMGVNSALDLYGNRNTKEGGSKIPSKLSISVTLMKCCDIDPTLRQEVGTNVLVKLLNGSVKNMNKPGVKSVVREVAPIVNWQEAMKALNDKGVELLIDSGVDNTLYLDYITSSKQRLLVLHQDMGM